MRREDNHPIHWRQAELGDLSAINRISDDIHVDLPERAEVFEEKSRLFPRGCLVLCEADAIVGYGFFYPWQLYLIPPLDTLLVQLPFSPNCMFIHDVVVLPGARGRGAAKALVHRALNLACHQGIAALALVSVYNSHTLWAQVGFKIVIDARVEDKLKSYGSSARYMIRMAQSGDPPLASQ